MHTNFIAVSVALVAFLACIPQQAFGWSAGGHKVVAVIAYDRLNDDSRDQLVRILEKHPRFQEDFLSVMPQSIANGPKRDRQQWLLAEAAIWPDKARDFPEPLKNRYHRSGWHYVNVPVFLDAASEKAMKNKLTTNLSTTWKPNGSPFEMNALQALDMIARRFASGNESDANKAILICWAAHIIGDLHQPAHSVALFSQNQFNNLESGDQGANLIMVRFRRFGESPQKLHSYWDGLLGRSHILNENRKRAFDILQDPAIAAKANASVAEMKPMAWAQEGLVYAKAYTYTPELLAQVAQLSPDSEDRVGPVTLPSSYKTTAGAVAGERAAVSGYRLAKFLDGLVGD